MRAQLKRTDYPVRKAVWKGRSSIQGTQCELSSSGLIIQRGRQGGMKEEETGSDWPDHFLLSGPGGHVVQVNCPIYPDISEYAAFTVSG